MPRQSLAELRFPYSGLNEAFAFHGQRPDTSANLQNVRAFDPTTGRSRGAQRAGLTEYLDDTHAGGANPFQCLFSAAYAKDAAYGATTLPTRDFKRLAICQGTIEKFDTSSFTTVTNGASALLSTAPIIQAAQLFDLVYFADSSSEKVYNMTTDTVSTWTESTGNSLPTDGTYKPRLICTYRGRIVLAGLPKDPANWFASAVGDGTDFDYAPATTTETQAMSGDNALAGKSGDSITALIPIEDDLLIFGGDHTIEVMRGDPMAGGRIDNVTLTTGILFGSPHTRDPQGNTYFFGSRGGIYRMNPDATTVERITSTVIDERLSTIDIENVVVNLEWDDRTQGMHVFITPLTAAATTHYYYDARNDAWFADVFASTDHDPIAVALFDGDDPADRAIILGGRDGRLRKIDMTAKDDAGTAINSFVWFGPIKQPGGSNQQLTELTVVLGKDSYPVYCDVFTGSTAEDAFNSSVAYTTRLKKGRNTVKRPRTRGHAIYLRFRNRQAGENWQFEHALAGLEIYDGAGQRIFV